MVGITTDDLDDLPDEKINDKFLESAIIFGYLDGVKRYVDIKLKNGEDIPVEKNLDEAIYYNHLDIVKYLLDTFDSFVLDKKANVELRIATYTGNLDMIKYFVEEKGMPINDKSYSLLQIAIKNGHKDVTEYFLTKLSKNDLKNIEIPLTLANPSKYKKLLPYLDEVGIKYTGNR